MDSEQQSSGEDGVYLTPQHEIDEALQRMATESIPVEKPPEMDYKLYDNDDCSDSSESMTDDNEGVELEEVYVLPSQDRTTSTSQEQVVPTQRRREVVQDLYDENNYSLANVDACPTKAAGVLIHSSNEENKQTVVTGKSTLLTVRNI